MYDFLVDIVGAPSGASDVFLEGAVLLVIACTIFILWALGRLFR